MGARTLRPPHAARRPVRRIQVAEALLKGPWPYVLAAGAGAVVHLGFAEPLYAWYDRIAAWLALLTLLVVLNRYFASGKREVPVLPLVAAHFYLFYGLPQFSQQGLDLVRGYYVPSARAVTLAAWLAALGEWALLGGYWLVVRCGRRFGNVFDRILPLPNQRWRTGALIYAIPCLVGYAMSALRPAYIPLGVLNALLEAFNVYLVVPLLFYLGYWHHLKACRVAGWSAVAIMASVGMVQGMLEPVLAPIVVGTICVWIWGGRFRLRWAVVAALAFLIINPVKYRFRDLSWGDKDVWSAQKVEQRVKDWSRAFFEVWLDPSPHEREDYLATTAGRTSDLLAIALGIDLVPDVVPYDQGRGLRAGALYWIPRVVWPSKPLSTDLLNNRYSVTFGYQTEQGTLSSTIALYPATEGFWSFGVIGALVYLGLSGVLLGLLLGNCRLPPSASMVAAMAYLGPSPLQTPGALAVAIPGAVTFSVGIAVAMWIVAALVTLGGRQSRK